jgi:branched-chain amino acid transport system substrate-binding protein
LSDKVNKTMTAEGRDLEERRWRPPAMKEPIMTADATNGRSRGPTLFAAVFALFAFLPGIAQAQEIFKLGLVAFLSGPAAESFGVPARHGGEFLIEQLNEGVAPAPYEKVGFGGLKIEPIIVDENGGATRQVQELRNLYQRENVDAVIGYISSGDCLAVAPVAEELKEFLILFDCGTPRIFEDASYKYVFRTAAHATQDNVALGNYMKSRNIKVGTYSLINQDYAWGQDSRADFVATMGQLFPDAKMKADLLPKFGAGQYGTEISALARDGSDVIYSSLWGGDLQAFILQGAPRGLFQRRQLVLSAADHVLQPLGEKMPDGAIIGARGAYGLMSPKTPLNDWFFKGYQRQRGVYPVQASYRMAQAIFGLKTAVEKAMRTNGGKKPSADEMAAALENAQWESPGGKIQMKLGNGHQAIQTMAIGRTKYNPATKMVVIEDIQNFDAECVNPPAHMKSLEWIKAGFPGAKCGGGS